MKARKAGLTAQHFDLEPGRVLVGIARLNLNMKIQIVDPVAKLPSKGKDRPSGQIIQTRVLVLDPGNGTHADVLKATMELQNSTSTYTTEDLVLQACEKIQYCGKPGNIFNTNDLVPCDVDPPTWLLEWLADPASATDTKGTQQAGEKGIRITAAQKAEIRSFTLTVDFPTHWIPPFEQIEQIRITKTDWQWSMVQKLMGDDLSIQKLHRIQNRRVWIDYTLNRQQIAEANRDSLEDVAYPPRKSLDSESNEFYLFHGLNAAIVDTIANEGFDERVSNLQGVFGSGIYFADTPSLSLSFAHTRSCSQIGEAHGVSACSCRGTRGLRVLLLCRVCLGTPYVTADTQELRGLRRPPHRTAETLYDSVVAGAQPPEYVVFDRRQVYPEYVIQVEA